MVVGEFTQEADLLVIGGGPGGYSAAFRAVELGVRTILVDDRASLGGVCLHSGCVPSKTLLHIAETIELAERAAQFGVQYEKPRIDLDAMRSWVNQSRDTLAKGLAEQAKKLGVEVLQGRATFEDSRHVRIAGEGATVAGGRVRFRRAIIAAGSSAVAHPALPFGEHVMTPEDAMELRSVPKRLLIVGSDYMAVELASIYAALGNSVTLTDEGERLLPEADADLVRPLEKRLSQRLAHLGCGMTIRNAKGLKITFSGENAPKDNTFDAAIVAIGRKPNLAGLNMEKTQAKLDERGFIQVNEQMRTDDPRIFAAGDVTGCPLLADHAMLQGRIAADVVAGRESALDRRAFANVVFTNPQVAWCGLTEEAATRQAAPHAVVKVPWGASGRAVGMGRTDGMTKIIYERDTKLLLGVGIVGVNAVELIGEAALAIEMGAVLDDLAGTIHPHPTLCEMIHEAARRVVHAHG
jgi:dihydrolipoamide dehydrogenase